MNEETKKARWCVGSNMPGYLPDSDPSHFSNWKDARDCFIYDCEQAIEETEHEERYSVERNTLKRLKSARKVTECQTKIGDYVYWLSRI